MVRVHHLRVGAANAAASARRHHPGPRHRHLAQPSARTAHGRRTGTGADRAAVDHARLPIVAHAGRHHPHVLAHGHQPQAFAGVDSRRPLELGKLRLRGFLLAHVARRRHGRGGCTGGSAGRRPVSERRITTTGAALAAGLAGSPCSGLAYQQGAGARRQVRTRRGSATRVAPDRPAHLAVLRHLRGCRGPAPAARQFPGGPAPRRRASHLAHQHRALSTGDRRGARLRLVWPARCTRSHRGDTRHTGADAEVPRSSL